MTYSIPSSNLVTLWHLAILPPSWQAILFGWGYVNPGSQGIMWPNTLSYRSEWFPMDAPEETPELPPLAALMAQCPSLLRSSWQQVAPPSRTVMLGLYLRKPRFTTLKNHEFGDGDAKWQKAKKGITLELGKTSLNKKDTKFLTWGQCEHSYGHIRER